MKKAMYQGKLPIGGIELNCAILENETRVLSASSIFEAFGRTARGLDIKRQNEIKAFLDQKK